jgi:hypothetical protein
MVNVRRIRGMGWRSRGSVVVEFDTDENSVVLL